MKPSMGSKTRRGSALVPVILVLSLLLLVFGVLARLGLAERSRARGEERRMRASWLAESGLERAWARLGADPSYRGETWEHPPESLRDPYGATVVIRVEPVPGRPDARRVGARADYPRSGPGRARQSRSALMNLEPNASPTR